MENSKSTWSARLRAAAGMLGAAIDWYERLPALIRLVVYFFGPGTVLYAAIQAATGWFAVNLPWTPPNTLGQWVLYATILVFVGLGVVRFIKNILPMSTQLLAPRRFEELPVNLKNDLLEIHERGKRTYSISQAGYKSLSDTGLIRDTLSLASKKVVVRPTRVGAQLAEEWKHEKERLREQETETVDRTGVSELQMLHPDLKKAVIKGLRLLDRLFDELGARCSGNQEECPEFWVAAFVKQQVHKELKSRFNEYTEKLRDQQTDRLEVQSAFLHLYKKYVSARTWIGRLGAMLDRPIHNVDGFKAWCEADNKFDDELERCVMQDSLSTLRQRLAMLSTGHGPDFDCSSE